MLGEIIKPAQGSKAPDLTGKEIYREFISEFCDETVTMIELGKYEPADFLNGDMWEQGHWFSEVKTMAWSGFESYDTVIMQEDKYCMLKAIDDIYQCAYPAKYFVIVKSPYSENALIMQTDVKAVEQMLEDGTASGVTVCAQHDNTIHEKVQKKAIVIPFSQMKHFVLFRDNADSKFIETLENKGFNTYRENE